MTHKCGCGGLGEAAATSRAGQAARKRQTARGEGLTSHIDEEKYCNPEDISAAENRSEEKETTE